MTRLVISHKNELYDKNLSPYFYDCWSRTPYSRNKRLSFRKKQITNMTKNLTRYTFQKSYRKGKNGFFIFPKTKVYSIRIWKSSLKMKWLRNFPPFFVTQVFDLVGVHSHRYLQNWKKEHITELMRWTLYWWTLYW